MYIDNIPNIGIVTSWEPYNIPLVGGEIYSVSPNQTISYIGDYSIGVCISFRYSLSSIEALDHKEIENRFSGVIPSS
jgi:hypothetical protein